ncbi:YitT family protein [Bacillus sp. HMF5848]|uniref:YitT family protein n=1 Tax=Bacillus sp. HMF5848 TaxID=2495421 RepID=UPI000F79A0D3|nr:YitT family protein [Bacillus sp. HMF5848]RSK27689.1 YitT family protein [Bacillus sp. HMF5848]
MEKWIKIFFGILIVSTGVIVLKHSNIVTGGTAGLALSLVYLTSLPFSIMFFIINLPFYIFSIIRMGVSFTVSTICSVSILTLLTLTDSWLPEFSVPAILGAVLGGFLIGIGLTLVFMQGSSLGGANILALFLQKRFNINPGRVNFLFDFFVVIISMFAVGIIRGLFSILSIYVTAKVIGYYKHEIAKNHTQSKHASRQTSPKHAPAH